MNMFLLLVMERSFKGKLLPGDLLFTYLIVYPLGRFLLEFMRLDTSLVGGINVNQITMLAVVIFAAVMLFLRHRKNLPVPADDEIISTETAEVEEE